MLPTTLLEDQSRFLITGVLAVVLALVVVVVAELIVAGAVAVVLFFQMHLELLREGSIPFVPSSNQQ